MRAAICIFIVILVEISFQMPPGCPEDPVYYRCAFCQNQLVPESNSTYQLTCVCPEGSYLFAGTCFQKDSDCQLLTFQDQSTKQYIVDYVNSVFGPNGTARNQTFPNPLPDFMNNFSFDIYDFPYLRQWAFAIYFRRVFDTQWGRITSAQRLQLYADAVALVQNTRNISVIERWQQYNLFLRTKFDLTSDVAYLVWKLDTNLKNFFTCECNTFYYSFWGQKPGSNTVYQCKPCPTNCQKCKLNNSNVLVCETCAQPYQLTDQNTCQLRTCTIPNCDQCSIDQSSCYTCKKFYGVNQSICQACSPNCQSCSFNYDYQTQQNQQYCYNCIFPYRTGRNIQTGICYLCNQIQCLSCQENNAQFCLQCDTGFTPNATGLCVKCPQNCYKCSGQTCTMCKQGYNISSSTGLCVSCPTGCSECNVNLNICYTCFFPMFILSPVTRTCYLNFFKFKNFVQIMQFTLNFDVDSLCNRPGCAYCYPSVSVKCAYCLQTYYMDNYNCKKCAQGCINCKSPTFCTKCLSSYTLISTNNTCITCPTYCSRCTYTNNAVACAQCIPGYTPINNVCTRKTNNCIIQDFLNSTKCKVCQKGYTANDNGQCIRCLSSCLYSCNPRNISQCIKFSIQDNFASMYSDTPLVMKGCLIATSTYCMYPMSGYELKNVSGVVSSVPKCLYLCDQCTDNQCTSCLWLDLMVVQNGKCIDPIYGNHPNSCTMQNCASCSSTECFECVEGYYYDGQACRVCSGSCHTCIDAHNCIACKKGYHKVFNIQETLSYQFVIQLFRPRKCYPCHPNCETCNFQSDACTSCSAGKKLVGGQCVSEYKIAFHYQINTVYQTFLSTSGAEDLITALATLLHIDRSKIALISITQGSTIVQGLISSASQANANQIFTTLGQAPLPGYTMISSQYSLQNSQDSVINSVVRDANNPYPAPSPDNGDGGEISEKESGSTAGDAKVGVIVGAVVGSVVAVAICAFIIYKYIKANQALSHISTQPQVNVIPKQSEQIVQEEGTTQLHVNEKPQTAY